MCPLPPMPLIREVRLAMLFVLNKGNLLFQLICTNNSTFTDFLLDCSSFENEALENEDQSTKHPNLENEAPKTQERSTQDSKTKHPNLENEAPKTRKRSTQDSKTKHPRLENEAPKPQKRSTQISKPL